MEVASYDPSKELRLLLAYFGESRLPLCQPVSSDEIPEPYRKLLVHNQHMTVTLEKFHKSKLTVRPYKIHEYGELYGRKLDLTIESGAVVLTGIMLFNFSFCGDDVREEIVSQSKPLGRILIEHDILREISTNEFLKIEADDPIAQRFDPKPTSAVYGRLATIYCNRQPAVDLLEVVAP